MPKTAKQKPAKPELVMVSLRLPREVLLSIDFIAEQQTRTRTAQIEHALKEFVKEQAAQG